MRRRAPKTQPATATDTAPAPDRVDCSHHLVGRLALPLTAVGKNYDLVEWWGRVRGVWAGVGAVNERLCLANTFDVDFMPCYSSLITFATISPSFAVDRAMSPAQSEDSGLAPERGTTYATITLPRNALHLAINFAGKPCSKGMTGKLGSGPRKRTSCGTFKCRTKGSPQPKMKKKENPLMH